MTGGGGTPAELRCWLALHRAPGLGAARGWELVQRFGGPRGACEAPPRELAALGVPEAAAEALRHPDREAVEADLRWLEAPAHRLLTRGGPHYPPRLEHIADPPLLLFVRGDPELLGLPQLAMVGSRNPTPGGADTAFAFARAFARAGLIITSGLALGIDGAAHRGALAARGLTVAVAGHGLDRVYPARHRDLAQRILDAGGALVSEFPPGTPPAASNFPRRNRIISGLALGVLVVEAARRSGSLITARLASEQGREVFAVPGSIHNPMARGCHALIRQGAKLVETAADVLEEIAPQLRLPEEAAGNAPAEPAAEAAMERDPDYRRLLKSLGYEPVTVDVLVERSGLTPEAVSSMLLILELQGHVSTVAGGLYVRAAKRP